MTVVFAGAASVAVHNEPSLDVFHVTDTAGPAPKGAGRPHLFSVRGFARAAGCPHPRSHLGRLAGRGTRVRDASQSTQGRLE
jgi:hypothetical protein